MISFKMNYKLDKKIRSGRVKNWNNFEKGNKMEERWAKIWTFKLKDNWNHISLILFKVSYKIFVPEVVKF